MILLKDIYIENFMSIEQLSLQFEDDSIIAITGENGSGKSALLYAIAFALTGYRKGESYRDYVRTGCESSKIILNAILKGYPISYEIELIGNSRKGVQAPTRRVVTYKDKTYINSDYNQFSKEHELDYIESLMFLFQGSSDNLINVKPSERAQTLRKLFQFEFGDIVDNFKAQQDLLKAKNIEIATKINELSSRTFEKQSLIRTITPEGVLKLKKDLEGINRDLNNIQNVDESSIVSFNKRFEKAEKTLKEEEFKKAVAEKNLSNKESNYLKIEADIQSIDINKATRSLEENSTYIQDFRTDILSLSNNINSLNESKKVLLYSEKELKEQINICKTGVCHACGHDISPEHTKKIEKERDRVSKELEDLRINLESELDKRTSLQYKLDTLEKNNKKLEESIKKCESLINSKENLLKEIERYREEVKERVSNVERYKEEFEYLLKEKSNIDNLEPILNQRKYLENEKERLKNVISKNETDQIRNEEKRKFNEKISRDKEERDSSIKTLYEEQNNIVIESSEIKSCIDIFDTSFPNYIILQACQHLEDYINSAIQRIFKYMKVSLRLSRSGVSFFYLSDSSEDEWIPVSMASGAQKTILGLSYQIALAKMYGIGCILLDEADATMSDENSKLIYEFISSLDEFQQIIFISHRKESINVVKNSEKENNVIYYVKDGQYELI